MAASKQTVTTFDGQLPRVAIVGAGLLGAHIATELMLLGSAVTVFSKDLDQQHLDSVVLRILLSCEDHAENLLQLAGMRSPTELPWNPYDGEAVRSVQVCETLEKAVEDADIVIEAVPENLGLKSAVLADAARAAPQALLATSTMTIPLDKLQGAVHHLLSPDGRAGRCQRVVGLRFLLPVVFIPFVEVTLTRKQKKMGEETALRRILDVWNKSSFYCDVLGAAEKCDTPEPNQRLFQRVRLLTDWATRTQASEARLRLARRSGSETALSDLGFCEETCVVCLDAPATMRSVICKHRVMCPECAQQVVQSSGSCPLCRVRFVLENPRHVGVPDRSL